MSSKKNSLTLDKSAVSLIPTQIRDHGLDVGTVRSTRGRFSRAALAAFVQADPTVARELAIAKTVINRKTGKLSTPKAEATVEALFGKTSPGRPVGGARDPELNRAARAWAREQGLAVGARGSLRPEIVEAYLAAQKEN